MNSLSKEYITLFNSITSAIEELQSLKNKLASAQMMAESLYMEESEENESA